jgi:hypothetical protein
MSQPVDPIGIVVTIGFIAFVLLIVTIDRRLEQRRIQRRRHQAHRRMTLRRRFSSWVRQ